jgi:hypothetical protein
MIDWQPSRRRPAEPVRPSLITAILAVVTLGGMGLAAVVGMLT